MKPFVVATDFSECSLNALDIAINLASASQADIEIVHVCQSCRDDTLNPSERTANQEQKVEEKLESLVAQYQGRFSGKLNYKISEGRIYKAIVDRANELDAGLIIAGTHGASGFEEFFMGSNAYRIVTSSNRPTLTINQDFKKKNFSKILLPLDASKDSRQKVPLTADIARALGAEVTILGIRAYDDENIKHSIDVYCKQSEDHFAKKGVKTRTDFIESRKVAGVVMDYARKIDADLISIMSDVESDALSRILSPDVQRIVNHSHVPVLVTHPRETFDYQISFTAITG